MSLPYLQMHTNAQDEIMDECNHPKIEVVEQFDTSLQGDSYIKVDMSENNATNATNNCSVMDISFTHGEEQTNPITDKDFEKEELRLLLESWNQENILDHLLSENVFINVLKVIKRHHIEKLLKDFDLGTQILFEHNLETWRNSIGYPLMDTYDTNTSSPPLWVPTNNPTSPALSYTSSPYSRPSPPDESSVITLSGILKENPKGIILAEYYDKFSQFQEEQRSSLINTIAQVFDEKNIPMSLSASYRIEREILERFPSEKLEYYRTSKRGKLYNKSCNLKVSFKNAVAQHVYPKSQGKKKSEKKSRYEKSFVPEDDAEECLRSLKFDNLTSENFDNCWKACSQYRLNDIKTIENTTAVIEKWSFYKAPLGFRLIEMDFNAAFENENGLLNMWPNCVKKLTSFLGTENHVKDKSIRALLAKIKEIGPTENGRDAALLLALHGYFVPTNKIVKKDANGKNMTTKYTIKDSQESFMFIGKCQQQVEDHLLQLKSQNTSIQPFILAVGNDVLSIRDIYVYFNGIKFKFNNFLKAVDICYKTFYVFDLSFPSQSVMFWSFIETCFYKRESKVAYSKVHILKEILLSDNINTL